MDLRIKKVYAKLKKEGLDGLVVSSPANISYLTRFTSRDAYLLISHKANLYLTDSRYIAAAKKDLAKTFFIQNIAESVFKTLAQACRNLGLKRLGLEEQHLTYSDYQKIKEAAARRVELVHTSGLIEEFRQIKDGEELTRIRKAVEITALALNYAQRFISAGRREIEVAAELERFIRYHGAQATSFDIIIASGINSSFPHHLTSQRKIKNNESVLVDIGVEYEGYKSDLTRVFFLGKISFLAAKTYDIVSKAQLEAFKRIKPGVLISEIDASARQYIKEKGYGGFFTHNLGHGIGREVHEAPRISSREKGKLRAGMVFTLEPAIYLPHKFGMRVEDMVLVTQKKGELISGTLDK